MRSIKEYVRLVLSEDLDRVYTTADYAHRGQKRRTGDPYIIHPERVSEIVKQYYPNNEVAQMTALLHDTFEDAIPLGNVSDEEEMIALIDDSIDDENIAEEVIQSVWALTKPEGADYLAYLFSLLGDENATIVKLADMLDNLTDNPSEKQKLKYGNALKAIEKYEGVPSFINPKHWDALLKAIQ